MATTSGADEVHAIAAEQRDELLKAKALESDLDLAFRLQMEEAIAASISLLPSSSSSSPPQPLRSENNDALSVADAQSKELDRFEQERRDRELSEIESRKMKDEFCRRIHDQRLARDILRMREEDWLDYGDNFERPFGEASSSSVAIVANENFRLYFKGLVSVETTKDSKVTLSGIGVAICDPRDNLIFELSKPLLGHGTGHQAAEIKALIEGLETAIALDLKRVTLFCHYYPLYQYVTQRWAPNSRKITTMMGRVAVLQKKFTYCHPRLVGPHEIKFAFKLARNAIVSQLLRPAESNNRNELRETCVICLDDTDVNQIFSIDGCRHRYCFSCMRQHVEAKLHHGVLPTCPHENCKSELNVSSCEKFLTPKLIEIMKQRIREASIPVAEKVYCPYPRCSALMSKSEVSEFSRKESVNARMFGARKCMTCNDLFCINCKVPWHNNLTCSEYKKSNPYPPAEDVKLKSLAFRSLWRQCIKCNHMIELAEGCYHMTCRCGYEFCYTCGAPWKNKKATCSCPLWDEENILFDHDDFDEDDDDDEDDGEYDYDDFYSDSDEDLY